MACLIHATVLQDLERLDLSHTSRFSPWTTALLGSWTNSCPVKVEVPVVASMVDFNSKLAMTGK